MTGDHSLYQESMDIVLNNPGCFSHAETWNPNGIFYILQLIFITTLINIVTTQGLKSA